VRQELIGSAMTEVPLVEGVEMINFQYGIDTLPANPGPDGVPEFFTDDPGGQWGNVVAVKVTVLVRSPTVSVSYDDSGKTYDLDGNGVADYRCTDYPGTPACSFKRKVFSQTFQVRNIAQRRGA
jgi:type IV pilus assembly protein PilW